MNEILLQRSETQDSVIEDPESSNTKTNDNHESRTCVQCSFIPDDDNQVGFEKIVPTGIQNSREPSIWALQNHKQPNQSDGCSYEVLYNFDADEYYNEFCSIYNLNDSDEFLTVTEKQIVKSNGINIGSNKQ